MSLWDAFRTKPEHVAPPVVAEPPKPTFVPKFRDDVAVLYGGRVIATVAPSYCATYATAERLAEILADLQPTIEMRTPLPFHPQSPTWFADQVPWIAFPDDRAINAGLLANFFARYPYADAERYARKAIAEIE